MFHAYFSWPAMLVLGVALCGCTIESKDNPQSCGGDGGNTSQASSSSTGVGSSGGMGGGGGAGGAASTSSSASSSSASGTGGSGGSTVDPEFLPIPSEDDTFRVVVDGDGWEGYDRSCGAIADDDSYHTLPFERAYIQATSACAAQNGTNSLVQIFRSGGLVPGYYDSIPDTSTRGQISVSSADYPDVESAVAGKLWIKTVETSGGYSLIEASFYGTTRWRNSLDNDSSEADVVVKVAFRVRIRAIDS